MSKLSEALGALLERPDLDTALKLVLGKLEGDEPPVTDAVMSALKDIHISGIRNTLKSNNCGLATSHGQSGFCSQFCFYVIQE